MRLSPAMIRYLRYFLENESSTLGRPGHRLNRVTHDALLRRGLIKEADDTFHTTTLTAEGRVEAVKTRD